MGAGKITIRLASSLLAVVWVGIFGILGAFAQDADATATVRARYEKLLAEYSRFMMNQNKSSPSATTFSIKNNMVSKELKSLLLKDDECARKNGGICKLDFDFLFNGQDYCKQLKIVDLFLKGTIIDLKVSNGFEECDKNGYYKPYDFTLIEESGSWVIDNAAYSMKDDNGKIINFTLKDVLNGKN